jgi:hypothetical protein
MSQDELGQMIRETEATLVVLREGLRATAAELRAGPLEVDVEVFHAGISRTVRKPHPALRRSREIQTSIRAFEKTLKGLRNEEKRLDDVSRLAAGKFSQFAPKARMTA